MATTKTASTAIRLGITGDPEVKRKLEQIGETGDAAAQRLAKSFVKADAEFEAALERRERQAAKVRALMPGLSPEKLDGYAGVQEGTRKSAESSAQVFGAFYQEMERRASALTAAIDPLYAAQQRFNREMAEANALLASGVLSHETYQRKLEVETMELNRVAQAQGRLAGETGRSGTAFASAAPQIQDFIVQATMGGNVIQALVVQGGQLAGQMVYVEGKIGSVARVLMGPWGVAAQVALMVLAPFVSKLFEGSDAAEKQAKALEEHRKAVVALAEAQEKAITTAERKQALDTAQIKLELDAAAAVRQKVQAELESVRVRLVDARQRSGDPTLAGEGGFNPGAVAATNYDRQMTDLTSVMTGNARMITQLQSGFGAGMARMIGQRVDAANSPQGYIEAQYKRIRSELEGDPALQKNGRLLAAKLQALGEARDRELEAVKESTKALKRDAETLTANQVAKMLRGELEGVRITSTTGGTHVKNSYHYRNQAVDFVPAGGMGSMTKDDVRRIFESRGINVVELLGPGDKGHSDHFHVAWTKGKHSLDEFTDAAKRAKESAEELTSLRLFTNGDAIGRALVGVREATAQQKGEFDRAARDVLQYDSNPLAGIVGEYDAQQRVEVDRWNEENARRVEKQRDDIAMLSNLWQTGFSGGAKGVWDIFRQQGMQVLSELLARWMVMGNLKGAFGEGGVNTGIFGQIGKLFSAGARLAGGGSANTTYADPFPADGLAFPKLPSAFAVGTHYSSAGAALVGENGPELVNLPRGSRVTPAAETRRMLAMNDNPAPAVNNYYLSGNLMTPEFWAQIQQSDDMAAARGAAGGATISRAEAQAQGARRLGRNWR